MNIPTKEQSNIKRTTLGLQISKKSRQSGALSAMFEVVEINVVQLVLKAGIIH